MILHFILTLSIILLGTPLLNAGTLLISNYPEEIYEPGILVSTQLPSVRTRLMYYHLNRAPRDYLVHTLLQNRTASPITIQLIRAAGGPSQDGIYSGHRSAMNYWTAIASGNWDTVTLAPFQRLNILSQSFRSQMVSTALFEFECPTPQAVELIVGTIDPNLGSTSMLNQPAIPSSYGTFPYTTRPISVRYTFDLPVREIPIGDEPFLVDPQSGFALRGNYGLVYDITITAVNSSDSPREFSLLFAPAGGISRGALLINRRLVETGFIGHKNNLAPEKVYSTMVAPRSQIQVLVQTLPQGGCFYPVNLVISSPTPTLNTKEPR
ncbi:hypothetical protein EBR57_04095 [bacterium]|nr:hypothetical protein [bacterium]